MIHLSIRLFQPCLKCPIYAGAEKGVSDDFVFSTSNISISIAIYLYFYVTSRGSLLSAKWFESSGPDPTHCAQAHANIDIDNFHSAHPTGWAESIRRIGVCLSVCLSVITSKMTIISACRLHRPL